MDVTVDRPDYFPAGTAIGVYVAEGVPDRERAPSSKSLQNVTIGLEGEEQTEKTSFKVEGLTEARRYLIGGKVGGLWRYLQVVPGKMGASLKPPARYSTHPAG